MKKLLALVLALVMTLSLCTISNAAFTDAKDVDASYEEAVAVLNGMGVFKGYEDGSFKPEGSITRAEVAAIVYRLYTGDVKDKQAGLYAGYGKFDDMAGATWAAGYVGFCANAGFVKGYGNGKFGPSDPVTGYQALAMILRAVGYGKNGEFEGADWELHVAQIAQQLKVLKNVKGVSLKAAASRELVAELLFQVAAYVDTVEYTPAFGYVSNTVVTAKAETLGEKNFNLTKSADGADNWGRPQYKWFSDDNGNKTVDTKETKYATIQDKPVATYTTKVTECDISAAAFDGKDKTNLVAWVNGAKLPATYTIQATDVYTKLGAQGRLTEVYEDRIVMIDTLLAKVTGVTTIKYDAAGHRINTSDLTLRVYDRNGNYSTIVLSQTTDWTYTVGQYVLVNVETATVGDLFGGHGNAIATDAEVLGVADSFVGAQTVIHYNDGKHTIDGVDYLDASCLHLNEAGISSAKYTWFKDQYGNVIGSAIIPTTYEYGVIKNIQWFTQAGVYGYAQATLTLMDGTEVSKQVSAIATETDYTGAGTTANPYVLKTGTDISLKYCLPGAVDLETGYVSTEIAYNYAEFSGTDLYRIADNGNGTVTLVNIENPVVGGTEQASVAITKGAHRMGSVLVDSNTQYLVRTVATTADDATPATTYTAVAGFNNIGSFTDAKVDSIDLNGDGRADYVYIIGVSATAKTSGLFYRSSTSNSYYVPVTGTESDYYVLNGYFNGAAGTIKTKSASVKNTIIDAAADTLFDVKIENGYVVAATPVPVANTALNAITGYRGPYTGLTGSSYKDDGSSTTVADFTMYFSGDALTIAGVTGWNVTEATRVVGTLEAGRTYDSLHYTFHIVWSTDALGNMTATEVYVFEKTPGADGSTPVGPTTWTVQNSYEYAIDSGSAPNYVGRVYTASAYETLANAATEFGGSAATMYVTAPGGLRHTASTTELATSIRSMLTAGYTVEMTNASGTWTFVLTK